MKRRRDAAQHLAEQLAPLVFDSLDEALASLPPDVRESYNASQRSVTEARRYAERVEGQRVIA